MMYSRYGQWAVGTNVQLLYFFSKLDHYYIYVQFILEHCSLEHPKICKFSIRTKIQQLLVFADTCEPIINLNKINQLLAVHYYHYYYYYCDFEQLRALANILVNYDFFSTSKGFLSTSIKKSCE